MLNCMSDRFPFEALSNLNYDKKCPVSLSAGHLERYIFICALSITFV